MESGSNASEPACLLAGGFAVDSDALCRNLSGGASPARANRSEAEHADAAKGSTPMEIAIVITALYSIVCVVGLVGNVLVMYVIISQRAEAVCGRNKCPLTESTWIKKVMKTKCC